MQQENLVGSTLGQYQILDELGRGGMAVVYKAWQPSLRRYVALKVLLPYLGSDPEFIQRFQQEGIVAANLNHSNIVTIYEVGQQEGRIFIAMEYVEGHSLEQIVLQQGGLPLERAVNILRQVATALDYAHKRRFVHRDIKPANILIAEDDRVVITDFGIAKALEGSGATARLTSTGTVLGTPAYMSPEQIQGLAVDYRSDLYALGIVAYEMLSGQVPFDGTTTALLYAQVNNPPPAITRFAPGLPPHVEWVIARMLAKQPSERFVSAGEFVEALASGGAGVGPAYGAAPPSRFPTPPPQNSTAVMPPGMQLPQPYGGTSPGAPNGYGYPPTQAAPGFPSAPPAPYGAPGGPPPVGYMPSASPWAEPAPVKKKRKVWPWILGGGVLLGVVAAVVVLGYLFLVRATPGKLLEEGQTALAAQDYAAAQAAFEQTLEKDPENAAAYRGLGQLHYAQARYEQAAQAFSNAVRLEPDNVEGQTGWGRSLYATAQYEAALGPLQQWSVVEGDNVEAQLLTGWAYYHLQRYTEAMKAFDTAVRLDPANLEGYEGKGRSAYAAEDYEAALSAAKFWAEHATSDVEAHRLMGWAAFNLQRYDVAVEEFARVVALEATPEAYRALGDSYRAMGNHEAAADAYEAWVELSSDDVEAHTALGRTLIALRRYDEAIAAFSRSLELDRSPAAYQGLGDVYYAQNDYEQAVTAYQQAVTLDAKAVAAHNGLGWSLSRMERYSEAIAAFKRSVALEANGSGFQGLGVCYTALGEYEAALEAYQNWLALAPGSVWSHKAVGGALFTLKRYEEAVEIYSRCTRLESQSGLVDCYAGLGDTQMVLKNNERALEAYLEWVERSPNSTLANSKVAAAYIAMGDCANARIYLDKALSIDPNYQYAKNLLKQCP